MADERFLKLQYPTTNCTILPSVKLICSPLKNAAASKQKQLLIQDNEYRIMYQTNQRMI